MRTVIIIGGGPAGITAGFELLKLSKEYKVKILEESYELGGISRTVQYHGNRMDIGGHRFFSKDPEVNAWWRNVLPVQGAPAYDDLILKRNINIEEGGPDPEKEDKVMLNRKRVSRIYYQKKFFDYPVKVNVNTIRNMGFATTIHAGFSYFKAMLSKKPEISLENFYINRFGHKLYAMFFEGYTEKLWGRHPKDISADWGAQRVKGLSIIAIINDIISKAVPRKYEVSDKIETSLIEEFQYPKYGPGQMWTEAANKFEGMGGNIQKGCKVIGVHTHNDKADSVIYIKDGERVEEQADIIISSMPMKDLIGGMNDVPDEISRIANGLPYRDFVTVGILTKKINLQNKTKLKTLNNLVPDCWIYVQDSGVKLGRIQIFNNWSPYLVEKPEETVWMGLEYFCNENDEFWMMDNKKWIEYAIKELVNMDILSDEKAVIDFHVEKVKKAYPAYFDTYSDIDKIVAYLNNFNNLYCVGRNGQHRYNNMDHSMVTAFETVKNIIHEEKDKKNIWNVNTDQEYHEKSCK